MEDHFNAKMGLLAAGAMLLFVGSIAILGAELKGSTKLSYPDGLQSNVQPVANEVDLKNSAGTPLDAEIVALIQNELRNQNGDMPIDTSRPMRLVQKSDITGDGVAEYIVDTGNGGASNDAYTIVKTDGNQPTLPRFEGKDGTQFWPLLLAGTGGAGRYYNDFIIDPKAQAVYVSSYSINGQSTDTCITAAYVWDESKKVFKYSDDLSLTRQKDFDRACDEVRNTVSSK